MCNICQPIPTNSDANMIINAPPGCARRQAAAPAPDRQTSVTGFDQGAYCTGSLSGSDVLAVSGNSREAACAAKRTRLTTLPSRCWTLREFVVLVLCAASMSTSGALGAALTSVAQSPSSQESGMMPIMFSLGPPHVLRVSRGIFPSRLKIIDLGSPFFIRPPKKNDEIR